MNILLDNTKTLHSRKIYNYINLIGDLGGVFELIKAALSFFILPFATHNFILKAIEVLYLSKSTSSSMFISQLTSE